MAGEEESGEEMEPLEESRAELMQRLQCSVSQHLFASGFDPQHVTPSGASLRDFSLGICGFGGLDRNGAAVVVDNSSDVAAAADNANGVVAAAADKRPAGIPPAHPHMPPLSPYSKTLNPASRSGSQQYGHGPSHARSLSQPATFFFSDSLPLSPSPYRESPSATPRFCPLSVDVRMEGGDVDSHTTTPSAGPFSRSVPVRAVDGVLPPKAHRRSHSEVPLGFCPSSFPMVVPPLSHPGFLECSVSAMGNAGSAAKEVGEQFVRKERVCDRRLDNCTEGTGRKPEEDVNDHLFIAYTYLDRLDSLNRTENEDKHNDLDSRASVTRANGADSSENEAESSVDESGISMQRLKMSENPSVEKKEGTKRSAGDEPASNIHTSRHMRSASMDSFMGKVNFADEALKLAPSMGINTGQHSRNNSLDGICNALGLEFGSGEFNGSETKKIMANARLSEIALIDPKRAKRILANRQSAARSKERKMRYISELEHKVQTLQTEATTLSAQLTLLQRDSAGLTSQNNELKFRLQDMEQQAQLRDALNEALTTEVQHLKIANRELAEANPSSSLTQHTPLSPTLFPLHQPPSPRSQRLQQQQQPEQQNHQQENSLATKHEANWEHDEVMENPRLT